MIKLIKATISKYKSIEKEQIFDVDKDITVLVGMNESGKTSILEAIAKTNYFEKDEDFTFNLTHDYPRKQKKAIDKSGENPKAIILEFQIDDNLAKKIESDINLTIASRSFYLTCYYDNSKKWQVDWVSTLDFAKEKAKANNIKDAEIIDALSKVRDKSSFDVFIKSLNRELLDETSIDNLTKLSIYFINKSNWEKSPINEYITVNYLVPNLPKFMYYDDYYSLPSRVSLTKIAEKPADSSQKTAKSLMELADIDVSKVIKSTDFEDFVAELEATQLIITEELFKYWSTNINLKINFLIDKIVQIDSRGNPNIVDHVLDIRVQNTRSGVSLPLGNRSKGFNWFFSFLVWFKKIQENKNDTFILLLDEPGLNLHAKAQNDLLRFLTDLSKEHQIIYTTHSPFMIESEKLHQVRTVLEKDDGTHISESIHEKDPNTLFPLQAALGYDLAQNLFVSKKNLIVEGIADLTYLTLFSSILESMGRECLKYDVTIVPVGGADKVATFVSLLRGNELNIVCLLDTFTDVSAKQRLDNLTAQNIIKDKKIVFYHDILSTGYADVEDLFTIEEYINLYNGAFSEELIASSFDPSKAILPQIKKSRNDKDFNHYRPANHLARNITSFNISDSTINNFENLFKKINKLF